MSDHTKIEWADSTFNPWVGCTRISPACENCYAEAQMDKRLGRARWGAGQPRVRTSVANWRKPLQWNAKRLYECEACGHRGEGFHDYGHQCGICRSKKTVQVRRRVFCASLADVFDNEVEPQWRADLFALILATPNLDWLLLTKRIGNAGAMIKAALDDIQERDYLPRDWPWPNVWIGATICNQAEADRDIPKLLATPAAKRFVSIEPMLGGIDLTAIDDGCAHREVPREEWGDVDDDDSPPGLWWNALTGERTIMHGGATGIWSRTDEALDWVIAGAESGPNARPSHPDWFRNLRDQCAAANVPFLFKQWGEWKPVNAGEMDWFDGLYRSNVQAGEGQRQDDVDESYGRTCTVRTCVVHRDGAIFDNLDTGAWQAGTGAILTFRVGKKEAGRVLDGGLCNGFPG